MDTVVWDKNGVLIRKLVAPNPSPMTYTGTNTYLLGDGDVAVIDPGPRNKEHFEAILASLGSTERVSHILVTHTHLDHSPLARELADATGAPIFAFGQAHADRSDVMQALNKSGDLGGGEGIDHDFRFDIRVSDGDTITGSNWEVTALHTPGHLSNHLCFAVRDVVFSGDHVMGWATSLVSPPDGDLSAFMWSCDRLLGRTDQAFFPGHGEAVLTPQERVQWLIDHRRSREAQILQTLADVKSATIPELTALIYVEVDKALHAAAARNVLAHLIDVWERNVVTATPDLGASAAFSIV